MQNLTSSWGEILQGLKERDRQRANNFGHNSTFVLPPLPSTSSIRTTNHSPSFADVNPPPSGAPPVQLRRPTELSGASSTNSRPATHGQPNWLHESTPLPSASSYIPLSSFPLRPEDLTQNNTANARTRSNAAQRELDLWSTTLFRNSDPPPLPLTLASSNYDILNLLSPHLLGTNGGNDARDRGHADVVSRSVNSEASRSSEVEGGAQATQDISDRHPLFPPSFPSPTTTSPSLNHLHTPHSYSTSPTISDFSPTTTENVDLSSMQRVNSLPKTSVRHRRPPPNSRRSSINSASPQGRLSTDGQSDESTSFVAQASLLWGSHSLEENESPRDLDDPEDVEEKRRRNTAASARFRAKKKQRVSDLQQTSLQLREKVSNLEKMGVTLRAENRWLRDLLAGRGEVDPRLVGFLTNTTS